MDARRLLVRFSPTLFVAALAVSPAAATGASAAPPTAAEIAQSPHKDIPNPILREFARQQQREYSRGYSDGYAYGVSRGYRAGYERWCHPGTLHTPNDPNTPATGSYQRGYNDGDRAGFPVGSQQAFNDCRRKTDARKPPPIVRPTER